MRNGVPCELHTQQFHKFRLCVTCTLKGADFFASWHVVFWKASRFPTVFLSNFEAIWLLRTKNQIRSQCIQIFKYVFLNNFEKKKNPGNRWRYIIGFIFIDLLVIVATIGGEIHDKYYVLYKTYPFIDLLRSILFFDCTVYRCFWHIRILNYIIPLPFRLSA